MLATGASIPPPPAAATTTTAATDLFAAVDMGTNSFKLTLIRIDSSSGRFLTLTRLKQPVLLGLDSSPSISAVDLARSISAVQTFHHHLTSLPPSHARLVATSAVREASNRSQFIESVNETLNVSVEVISGEEEARLVYLGVLQFFPVFSSTVLTIDIGGGSTEFTVGFEGGVLFSKSLRLGHVTLTRGFNYDVVEMRKHVRNEIEACGLVEEISKFKIDVVIGSSGTVKAIERAVSKGYAVRAEENVGSFEEFGKREWRFTRRELRCLLERLCDEEREIEGRAKRVGFFKRRAEFILAGTVLLDEVTERLGIEELEVSGYALGEGVIAEMLGRVFETFDLNANARWRSVNRLVSRFNNKKRMKVATMCAGIAREIFVGLKKSNEVQDDDNGDDELSVSLDGRDLEYLDAACLLHNIGLYTGKKGYHKHSYHIILNGDHLLGYSKEEIKLIALLVRHHRKKFPKSDVLEESGKQVKQKFRLLCTILRVSFAVQQCFPVNFQCIKLIHSPQGFKLVLKKEEANNQPTDVLQPLAEDINMSMEKESEHFRTVFKRNLTIQVT